MIEYDACDLSRLIERVYKKEFNVPYLIMQDQRKITMTVDDEDVDPALVELFREAGDEVEDIEAVFQQLLNDLCNKGHLEPGEYLIRFDD